MLTVQHIRKVQSPKNKQTAEYSNIFFCTRTTWPKYWKPCMSNVHIPHKPHKLLNNSFKECSSTIHCVNSKVKCHSKGIIIPYTWWSLSTHAAPVRWRDQSTSDMHAVWYKINIKFMVEWQECKSMAVRLAGTSTQNAVLSFWRLHVTHAFLYHKSLQTCSAVWGSKVISPVVFFAAACTDHYIM